MGTTEGGRATGLMARETRHQLTLPVLPALVPRLFPRSGFPARLIIQEEHDRPDLVLGEKVFPRRHRRIPRRAFARQAGAALGDPPEDEALGQLRDRAVVLEVGRQGIEPAGEIALAVEMVAVAWDAILIIDSATFGDMRRHLSLFA